MSSKRILITVPTMGMVRKELAAHLVGLSRDPRYALDVRFSTETPYANNMNKLALAMLDEDFDFWLNIDHDQCPLANPLDLVEFDKDVLGLPTPILELGGGGKYPFRWNVFNCRGDTGMVSHDAPFGLQQVDIVGSGALLIARRVIEAVEAPFSRRWKKDGTQNIGGDISFCLKAADAGFKVWAHYDYPSQHHKTVEMAALSSWVARNTVGSNELATV